MAEGDMFLWLLFERLFRNHKFANIQMHKSGLRKEAKWQRAEAGIYSLDYYLKDFGLSLKFSIWKLNLLHVHRVIMGRTCWQNNDEMLTKIDETQKWLAVSFGFQLIKGVLQHHKYTNIQFTKTEIQKYKNTDNAKVIGMWAVTWSVLVSN